jgi:PncC family amidohydrolase
VTDGHAWATDPPSDAALLQAARVLGDRLRRRRWRLATAESSSGGLLGHVITQVPGSSDYYLGGVVSYADSVKQTQLGIDAGLIERVGAVSSEVAEAMATGVLDRFDPADLALAITGVAGPDGGSEAKPVGLSYVALALRGADRVTVERRVWAHDRDGNKRASVLLALEMATSKAPG